MFKEIQDQLYEPFGGAKQQLGARFSAAQNGQLPDGQDLEKITQNTSQLRSILNESFAPRIIIASNPDASLSLVPEQIAIAGGWCALRTADVEKMNEGIIMNPETGVIEKVTSVEQVAEWIENSITFDQIVECIGGMNGAQYVAISEQKLWSDRIIIKIARILNKISLTSHEEKLIRDSVENAEKKRAEMTQRYLRILTGNNLLTLTRVVDEDFFDDLIEARDDLLKKAGLSVKDLQERFPDQAIILPSQTLIWAMYSEPYFDALRRRGYISLPTVFISEPTFHTYADDPAGAFVVKKIYQNMGRYFDPTGINPNTGFVAFMECIQSNGASTRKKLSVNRVPNISNWQNLFQNGIFNPSTCLDIDPGKNNLFLWAVNLIPFGDTLNILLALIDLKQKYKEEIRKIKIKSRDQAETIKLPFLQQADMLNQALAQELWIFFEKITENL